MKAIYLFVFVIVGMFLVSGCASKTKTQAAPGADVRASELATAQDERAMEERERSAAKETAQESQQASSGAANTVIDHSLGKLNLKVLSAACSVSEGSSHVTGTVQNTGAADMDYAMVCFEFRKGERWIGSGFTYVGGTPGRFETENIKFTIKAGETKAFTGRSTGTVDWDKCVVYSCG